MISKSDQIGWVEKLISPRFHKANFALNKLDDNQILERGDTGFSEIEKILKDHLITVPDNSEKELEIEESELIKLGLPMGYVVLGAGGTTRCLGVLMRHKGNDINFDNLNYLAISAKVEALKKDRVFVSETWVFAIGLSLAIASKIIGNLISVN